MCLRTIFVFLVSGVTSSFGAYLHIPGVVTHSQAIERCADFGMMLLEVRSQDEMDAWAAVKRSIVQSTDKSLWLGLTRDESSPSNYTWLHGGHATWLRWYEDEPDYVDTELCVRYQKSSDTFRTHECWQLHSVVCEDRVSVPMNSTNVFTKQKDGVDANDPTASYFKANSSPSVDPTWTKLNLVTPSGVLDECLVECHVRSECAMTYFSAPDYCLLFLGAP